MGFLAIILASVLIGIDQFSKYLAVKYLNTTGTVIVCEGLLNLTLVENKGAAFGIMQGARWFFVLLTLVIVAFIIFYFGKLPKNKTYLWVRFCLSLIGAGAVGNFIDRLRNGYVIDFLHVQFIEFPVFNMADIYVVAGTILLAIILLFFTKEGKKLENASIEEGSAES